MLLLLEADHGVELTGMLHNSDSFPCSMLVLDHVVGQFNCCAIFFYLRICCRSSSNLKSDQDSRKAGDQGKPDPQAPTTGPPGPSDPEKPKEENGKPKRRSGAGPRFKALFSLQSTGPSQLSFIEGDIVEGIGDKKEDWQYGENIRTAK